MNNGFWSSTLKASDASRAKFVEFDLGSANEQDAATAIQVRCVLKVP